MKALKSSLILAMLVLCSACVMTPKTHFYTLHGLVVDDAAAPATIAINPEHTYGIGPLFLPEALMQPGVVTHRQGQSVNLSLYNIWAGNLREAVTRVVASNMSQLTGVDAIWPFPWDNRNRPTRQIRIVFEQFSGELGGIVTLKAKWALTENNGEKTLLQERLVLTGNAAGDGYGPYVSTLNDLINQLSVDIASRVAVLD
ncbi:PqiC family protein [Marinagarivorans cellulosilyticus]|uniref:ABC-type transport auxiliary lipoprotein component domain-containing protein n=1 Tax=Marinagarivorans cellulosilyticus TaxID=2721545 RepID=A0AAN1WIS2_9GAMM|nr:PqiC family protein [Marinagarivorans cellulosilyticus]BCD98315.1 hypothetical protein MARGE09_P2516 [Marinagarivorans cellulosilyticus]